MMKIFNWKTILLAKHAQHIVLIHFPIALFFISIVFDILASMRKDKTFRIVARYNLFAAFFSSLLAIGSGVAAWQLLYDGGTPKGLILYHMTGAFTSGLLLFVLMIFRRRLQRKNEEKLSPAYLAITIFTAVVIGLTGHLGGIISGVIQIGE